MRLLTQISPVITEGIYIYIYIYIGKAVPLQAWSGPGFLEVKVPRFHDDTGW